MKILIAEDDRFLSKIYKVQLERSGHTIWCARDGEETLDIARAKKPDIILLDIIMPKKNGFEVLKELKNNTETKDIPVIILSNLGQSNDIKKAKELGACTYLQKTKLSLQEMIEQIQRYTKKQ